MYLPLWIALAFIFVFVSLMLYLLKYRPHRRIISFKGRLLHESNKARRKHGVQPLGRTKLLDKLSAQHSKSMARRKHCDHSGFNHRANTVKKMTGLSSIAENCYMFPAREYNSYVAHKLVEGWLKSPGHRVNLLNGEFKRTGIGIVVRRGYVYATQLFSN